MILSCDDILEHLIEVKYPNYDAITSYLNINKVIHTFLKL